MRLLALAAAGALAVLAATSAHGAFPGRNGVITVSSNRSAVASGEVYSVAPSGTGRTDLSRNPAAETGGVWSPDGSHAAFVRAGSVVVVAADGSGQLTLGPGTEPGWSPDGARLAFVRGGAVWSSALDGTDAHPLTGGTADHSPAWSPDGKRVAFVRGDALEVVPAGGGTPLELARGVNPGGQSFVWSGDGGSLVYANVYVLYRVAADASTDEVVLRAPSLIGPLALARDGVRLAYAVSPYTSTRGAGVWTVSLASGAPRQLTRSGQERVQFLSWAPAGDRVAFAQTNDVRIHLVAAATGIQTLLPREHPGTVFGGLEWSPDGKRLLFATEFTDDTELYSLLFSGSAAGPLRRLTLNWAEDVDPAWSPDGRTLAFASNRSGNFDVYTMRSDGSGLRRLTRDPADDREPAWSPDGSRIVFSSNRLAGAAERKARKNGYEVAHLYVVRADGSHLRRLTTGVTAGDHTPAWSPDGRVIVFSSWVQDPPLLETVLANGSRRRSAGETGTAPDWSPDGKSIVYLHVYYPDGAAASASSPPPQEELALMTPSGSPTSSLGDHAAAHWSPDGKLLASADGSILDTGGVVRGTIPPGQSSWQSR